MKRIFLFGFWILMVMSFILGSWYVLHGDIQYPSDIARDFFLLQQIQQKGIVLIGPNSSTGLFHGILWMYLNYPAYVIGHGNPVVVGWFWVLLGVVFVISGFFIAKKLFGNLTAYLYALMIALYTIFHVRGFYNPHGAMLVLPGVFYFFVRYLQTKKIIHLVLHILLLGATIQFQMAIGIPFTILSFIYIFVLTYKWKKLSHLFTFLLIPLTISNFIIFDLRHQFILSHLVYHFLTSAGRDHPNILSMIWQRLLYMTTSVEFFRTNEGYRNVIVGIFFIVFLVFQLKDKKHRLIYKTFLYFYVGFYVVSLLNAGGILYFYIFPLFPFVFLLFVSFVTSRYSKLFLILFAIIYIGNCITAVSDMQTASTTLFGKSISSWLFYKKIASRVFSGSQSQFGYYVYSPDVVAYQAKYALQYEQSVSQKKADYFHKDATTYLVVAPPPVNNPYMQDAWWTQHLLHMVSSPSATILYSNGYKIQKYQLSKEEQSIATEPNIDPGLSFR